MKLRILNEDDFGFDSRDILDDDNCSSGFMGVSTINQQDQRYSNYSDDENGKNKKKPKSQKKNHKQRYNTSRRSYD